MIIKMAKIIEMPYYLSHFIKKKNHFLCAIWNVQIRNYLEKIIFVPCKWCKICKYYVNCMAISCRTCKNDEDSQIFRIEISCQLHIMGGLWDVVKLAQGHPILFYKVTISEWWCIFAPNFGCDNSPVKCAKYHKNYFLIAPNWEVTALPCSRLFYIAAVYFSGLPCIFRQHFRWY